MNKIRKFSYSILISLFIGLIIGIIIKFIGSVIHINNLGKVSGLVITMLAFLSLNQNSNIFVNLAVPDAFWTIIIDTKKLSKYNVNLIRFFVLLIVGIIIIIIDYI